MDASLPIKLRSASTSDFKSSIISSLMQLTFTFACYLCLLLAAIYLFDEAVVLSLGLAAAAALFVVRLFIIQHDCAHLCYFQNKKANQVLGCFLSIFTLVPFYYWQRKHNLHHATSGNLDKRGEGDIWMLTVAEYRAAPALTRFKYRFYRNPFIMLFLGSVFQFIFKFRFPQIAPSNWRRERRDIWNTNLLIAVYFILLLSFFDLQATAAIFLVVAAISGTVGIFLFYVQHQFEEGYWASNADWDRKKAALAGSSYLHLPAWFNWLTGHIALHHVHHLNARIPNYNLKPFMLANGLENNAVSLSFKDAVNSLFLNLWDEKKQRLIPFSDLK